MANQIVHAQIPKPDFVLDQILDPEEFDGNNAELQNKINETIDQVNTNSTNIETLQNTSALAANVYTKTEIDGKNTALQTQVTNNANAIATKANASNVYTKAELDNGQLDNRYYTETEIQTNYYNKTFLDNKLRGGDTLIKYEVFTIVHANNGNGTFTYNNGTQDIIGELVDGYQRFVLAKGNYLVGNNRIEAVINDTLARSVASGGLREVGNAESTSNIVDLTINAGDTAEITFKYFERIGLSGEHASSHAVGGSDELIAMSTPSATFAGQFFYEVVS